MENKGFRTLLKESYKSSDTEEWLDVYFTRPIGLAFALMWARLGVSPNVITILSMFLGIGAGWCFLHTELCWNIAGVLLLMFANFCDSTDGQLARLTNQKTLLGRMLDGFASDVWYFCAYLAIIIRLWNTSMPFTTYQWGIWIFVLCAIAGILCHSTQGALADYYRQIHLYFLQGEEGSELDSSTEQQAIYDKLPKGAWWQRIYYRAYASYCRKQERLTPQFQKFYSQLKQHYPTAADIPTELRQEFRRRSLPLMKYTNILTHNTRATVLFVSVLLDVPYVYPLFEIVVLMPMYWYMRSTHENICRNLMDFRDIKATKVLSDPKDSQSIQAFVFDYGGTLDTAGCHWGVMIGKAYERQHVPVTTEQYREAYVHTERTLGKNPIVQSDYTFKKTLETKINLQFDYLMKKGALKSSEDDIATMKNAIVDDLYKSVILITRHSVEVLKELRKKFPMVLVSNFYGNIQVVLHEFDFDNIFDSVIESAVVGVRKPDPEIFRKGVEALHLPAERVMVVGDSIMKDILPAHEAGCMVTWLKGEGWIEEPVPDIEGMRVITDLTELL